MTMTKSCPGSRTIREPVPEEIKCPQCGGEVEIWTDELKATCPNCGHKVFREARVSCIDWCPHAQECVGPEVYQRLKPGGEAELAEGEGPLDVVKHEHQRALENIGLLRAAALCLKLGNLTPGSAVGERGVGHLARVLDFLDKDIGRHFRREEAVLFPALEKHLGKEKGPTRLLRGEHEQFWQWHRQLKAAYDKLQTAQGGPPPVELAEEVKRLAGELEGFLKEHIRKENETLLPLARRLFGEAEQAELARRWRSFAG